MTKDHEILLRKLKILSRKSLNFVAKSEKVLLQKSWDFCENKKNSYRENWDILSRKWQNF